MPNIASVLKEEILRLARKEARSAFEGLKKASIQYRADIAALKRQVASLEKQISHLEKRAPKKDASGADAESTAPVRFSAKGLLAHRQRLSLSAADMGTLIGVSAQTIYHWESGKSKPRKQQLGTIASLRKMGKRAALAQIANSKQP